MHIDFQSILSSNASQGHIKSQGPIARAAVLALLRASSKAGGPPIGVASIHGGTNTKAIRPFEDRCGEGGAAADRSWLATGQLQAPAWHCPFT